MNIRLIPKVNGTFELNSEKAYRFPARFAVGGRYPAADAVFAERMSRLGDYCMDASAEKAITLQVNPDFAKEAYEMETDENGIAVTSAGQQGYILALTTIYQILAQNDGRMPYGRISDTPRLERRGMMLDVCRHFFDAAEVKRIIEQESLLKMNEFHWHLSEDQGFRIESTKFPRLNEIGSWRVLSPDDPVVLKEFAKAGERYGGYYTKDEIRDVVAYAAARGVDVVPEIDLPGHSSAILACYPEFTCSGAPLTVRNTFGVHERIFCAGKAGAYNFLFELLDEIMELFPSQYIHLGGDEAPKTVWHDCPACNAVMKAQGYTSYEQLQCFFSGRIIEHVKAMGKTPIVWNDAAADGNLAEGTVVQYWTEMAPGPSYMVPEIAKGRRIIVSEANLFYCSSYADAPLRAILQYQPDFKETPVPDENILGVESPMWTEWCAEAVDIEKFMYPKMLAVAEYGWTNERSADEFLIRAQDYLAVRPLNILTPEAWETATIDGEAALQQIAKGMIEMARMYGSMSTGVEGEEAGKAEAVVPEGSEEIDMAARTKAYMYNKMRCAYTPEEIDYTINLIFGALAGAQ